MLEKPFRATFARSWRLLKVFRDERRDPESFYNELSRDSIRQLKTFVEIEGSKVLDVGGGSNLFRDAFKDAGANYFLLDIDLSELTSHGPIDTHMILGSGEQLPFGNGEFDITYSSNVIEHVRNPWVLADEMLRVTKPGGTAFISFTLWWGPWGGHETSPWHYFGGNWAAKRYQRKNGHPPKNKYGSTLFGYTASEAIHWAKNQKKAEFVEIFPRYLPRSFWWVLRIPLVREVVTWNIAMVLKIR